MENIKYTISQSKVLVELIICILTAAIMVWVWIRYGYSSGVQNNSHALVIESLRSHIAPEPFERAVYLSLLVILPIYFSTNFILKRSIVENTKPFICVALAFLSFLIFDFSYLKVLFGDIEAYDFFQPAVGLIFPVVYVLGVILYYKYDVNDSKRWIFTLFNLSAVLPLLFLWRIIPGDHLQSTGPIAGHLDLILYAISQSVQGKAPLYNLESQYGFYIEIFSIISKFTAVDLFAVTTTFFLLQVIGLLAVLISIQSIIRTKIVFVFSQLGFISISSTFHMLFSGADEFYLQYFPIRFIFPSLFLLLFVRYIEKPNPASQIILATSAAISLFWNLDSGIAVLYAWLSYNFIMYFSENYRKNHIINVIYTAAAIFLAAILFSIYSYSKSDFGGLPNFELFSKYQSVFWKIGFFMIPIPWPNSIAIYSLLLALLGLVVGLTKIEGRLTDHQKILVFVALLFLGLFSYYQGRSHVLNFALISWIFFILVLMMVDEFYISKKYISLLILTPGFILILISGFNYISKYESVLKYLNEKSHIEHSDQRFLFLREKVDFIKRSVAAHDSCIILTPHQGFFHLEASVRSGFDGPSLMELIMIEDLLRYRIAAEGSSCLIFGVDKFDPNLSFTWRDVSAFYKNAKFNDDKSLVYLSKD